MKILNQTYDYVKEGQIAPLTWNEIYSKTVRMRSREKLLTQSCMSCMFVLIDLLIQGKSFNTVNSSWKLRQKITIYALAIFVTRHQSPEATLNFQYIAVWDSRVKKQQISNVFANQEALRVANISTLLQLLIRLVVHAIER